MSAGVDNVTIRDHLNRDLYYNFFSSAPGDNRYVNPLPQFSPATDPRFNQFMSSKEGGMGTQYKRVYDDNASLVSITVGVAEFTGLLDFITNMFDPVAAVMANKGRTPGFMFYVGQAIGTVAFWPMQLVSISLQFIYWLTTTPKNQFYYVKPTMGLFLQSANNVLNDIMVNLGYIKPILPLSTSDVAPVNGVDVKYKEKYLEEVARLSKTFGDVINEDGTIDLARMMTRGTRKFRHFVNEVKKLDDELINTPEEKLDRIEAKLRDFRASDADAYDVSLQNYLDMELNSTGRIRGAGEEESVQTEKHSAYLDRSVYESAASTATLETGYEPGSVMTTNSTGETPGGGLAPSTDGSISAATPGHPGDSRRPPYTASVPNIFQAPPELTSYDDPVQDRSWMGDVTDMLKTAMYGGFDAITFRHDNTGEVTDSFTNSVTSSPMAEKFNSTVKSVNDFRFDLADGTLGFKPVDGLINMAKDALLGIASSASIVNIPLALANNSYINIPDHWSESSASLHRETYRFDFTSTYAAPFSQVTTMWAPFSLLLPIILPNAAGASAQTSPFMVKVFSKGRQIIRAGIAESATIRFGEGIGGWTKDRKPLNISVEIVFVDVEKYLSVPISRTSGLMTSITNPAAAVHRMLNDVGPYNSYIARITGTDYLDTILRWNQLSRKMTMAAASLKQSTSPSNIAGIVNDSIIGDIMKIPFRSIDR